MTAKSGAGGIFKKLYEKTFVWINFELQLTAY